MSLENAKCKKCGATFSVDSEKGLAECPSCHEKTPTYVAIEEYRSDKKAGRFLLIVGGIFAVIILMSLFANCDCSGICSCDQGYDYYYDANGNGKMDKGEYVYSEDSDGNVIGYDTDGDGWWD